MTTPQHVQFAQLRATLAGSLVEREPEIDAVLLALVAREHVLLVGPPGTAKSTLANSTTAAIQGAKVFSVLLTKFTTPEELFGPVKLSALRADRYERAIDGYMPTAHVVFIDEIWKASSAILNTTLTLLQERQYDNGGARVACPLRLSIAASNEWPSAEDGQELGAIFDRYLIRRVVRAVSPSNRDRLLYGVLPAITSTPLSLVDVDFAAAAAEVLPVSSDAKAALGTILDQLAGAGVRPGDRRARKAVGVARAAAWLAGSAAVQPLHLECLADVLWASPEQIDQTRDIVVKIANPVGSEIVGVMHEVQEILAAVTDETPAQVEASKKLQSCLGKAQVIAKANPANTRAAELAKFVKIESARLAAKMMGIDPALVLGGGA